MSEQFCFTEDFESLILACLVRHPDTFMQYGQVLEPRYFLSVLSTTTAKVLLSYHKKHNRIPTWETLGELVASSVRRSSDTDSELRVQEAQDYVGRLKELDTGDYEFVVSKVVDFARERAILAAIRKSMEAIKDGKLAEIQLVKLFEQALGVGQNLGDLGYILHADHREVVDKVTKTGYGISTGYPLLDRVWRFGWAPGWLIVPLAPPKRYKTTFCLNLALNMVGPSIGEDVLYYACEISQELAMARALMNLTGQNQSYMFESPEKFKNLAAERIQQLVAGNMVIKSFPSKSASIADIKAHAKTVIKQFNLKPKAIFIDYAETVKPGPAGKDVKDYRQQADIYTEARAMGHELGACIIMPDRCNRETVSRAVPSMSSFQGAFEKAGIVDAAIGICSTDSEIKQNVLRFFVFLNRHGHQYQHFRGSVDPEVMQITVDEEIEYDPEDEDEKPKRRGGGKKDQAIPDELIQ